MAAIKYNRTTNTTLKANGYLDVENLTITCDDVEKSIKTLIKEFNGCQVALSITLKEDEELDVPEEDEAYEDYEEYDEEL